MSCAIWQPTCMAGEAVAGAAGSIAEHTIVALGSAVFDALLGVFVWSTTLWLKPSVSPMGLIARLQQPTPGGPPPLGSQVMYLAAFVLVLGLLSVAIQLVWRRDGATLADAATGLFRAVLAIFAGLLVVGSLWKLSDAVTDWIAPQDFVDANPLLHAAADTAANTPMGPAAAVLMLVMSLLGILLSLLMAALMLFRTGTIAVLAIMLPLAGAGSLGASTRQWLPKVTGWLLALIFMRPMAAAVYRIGLTWMTTPPPPGAEGSPVTEQMTATFIGLLTMACAALTLPAMLKLFTWMFGATPTTSGAIAAGTLAGTTGLITAKLANGATGGAPEGAAPTSGPSGGGRGGPTPPAGTRPAQPTSPPSPPPIQGGGAPPPAGTPPAPAPAQSMSSSAAAANVGQGAAAAGGGSTAAGAAGGPWGVVLVATLNAASAAAKKANQSAGEA